MKMNKRFFGILFSVVMVLSLVPWISLEANADDTSVYNAYLVTTDANKNKSGDALTALQVKFNGVPWYIIEDDSTNATEPTVTLLAANSHFPSAIFSSGNNKYSQSAIKQYLDNCTTLGSFANVKDVIKTITVSTDNDSDVTAKIYLLSRQEASQLPVNVLKYDASDSYWYLRSPGTGGNDKVVCVDRDNGEIGTDGLLCSSKRGVRPALKLDLKKVFFDSLTQTFSLEPTHYHSFTYEAGTGDKSNIITATCSADGCSLDDGTEQHNQSVALKIDAPLCETYGDGKSTSATLDGLAAFNSTTAKGISADSIIYKKGNEVLPGAPTGAGTYTANITIKDVALPGGETGNVTASVGYTINPKPVTITGVTASEKTYDGNTTATVSGSASINGVLDGDNVDVSVGTAAFQDKNVGTDKPVTFSGFGLTGEDASNYVLSAQPSSTTTNITAKKIYIFRVIASDKVYDGTTTATITETGELYGLVSDKDDVKISVGKAAFVDKNVGGEKEVIFTDFGLTGDDASNYTLAGQPGSSLNNIIKKEVTITGATVSNKEYDGTTTANITGTGEINGKSSGDDVSITKGTASFGDKDVGEGKTVTFSGFTLSGSDSGNYQLFDQPESTTADITPKSITGSTVSLDATQKSYNGSEQSVNVTGVNIGGISLTADDYIVAGNTGTNKGDYTVTVTGTGNFKDTATAGWSITAGDMEVTAENVSVDYDSKPHGITVNVTTPASGAVVKYGTEDGVYGSNTSPTITDVGSLTVYYKVTDSNYKDVTGSATVTINKAAPAFKGPEPKTLTYNNEPQVLVTAGTTSDGTMIYAIGNETEATGSYSEDIPSATDIGTHYVWYKVVGDGNHNDSDPSKVAVIISADDKTDLINTINDANDYLDGISKNDDYSDVEGILKDVIDDATSLAENPIATKEEIDAAIEKLKKALQDAKDAVKDIDDQKAAAAVEDKIKALKDSKDITLNDKAAVEDARKAYDSLTDDQKALVSKDLLKKLEDDETAIKALEEASKKDGSTPSEADTPDEDNSSSKKYNREWIDGQWYDAKGNPSYKAKGSWHESDKGWWFGDESGWYAMDGWIKIDGKWYFFDEFGFMITDQYCGKWQDNSDLLYWVGSDGAWDESAPARWHFKGSKLWFGDEDGWFAKDENLLINGLWHKFDKDGYLEE